MKNKPRSKREKMLYKLAKNCYYNFIIINIKGSR